MKNYKIEEFKFYFAIAVVLIHTSATIFHQGHATFFNYYIYRQFLEYAVPFFFMASGFVVYKKGREYIPTYAINITALFVSSSLFYMMYKFLVIVMDRLILNQALYPAIEKELASLSMTSVVAGTIGQFHLWYLSATVIALLLIYILISYNKGPVVILGVASLLYVTYLTNFIDFGALITVGRGFIKAFFYIALGYYISSLDTSKIKFPLLKALGFIVLFTLLGAIKNTSFLELFLFLGSYYLFVYALNHGKRETFVSKLGRYSLGIYILHVFAYKLVDKVLIYVGYDPTTFGHSLTYVFLVTIFAVIFSMLIQKPISNYVLNPITTIVKKHFEQKA